MGPQSPQRHSKLPIAIDIPQRGAAVPRTVSQFWHMTPRRIAAVCAWRSQFTSGENPAYSWARRRP